MPDKCIVFGCNNIPNKEKDSPSSSFFLRTDDKEKWKRRKKIDAKLKHAHWKPTKYSAVCSKHFLDEDYSVIWFDYSWFFDFFDFNIYMQFYILLEPKNDLGKVATLSAFIADF